ncbi:MAG: hypothetical protein M1826_007152 [Phylliscum demangeonii]|nr:MAG: hypothetical protein M1826_007152 [Phylliscum demangeonii]
MPLTRRSPLLPTTVESVFFSLYPLTLLLGTVFSLLDPASRSAPYDPLIRSHPLDAAPSYFARKQNVFNLFFAKLGWFWTSIAFIIFLATDGSPVAVLTPRRLQGLIRYSLVTVWWLVVTRWFFGPGLIDRLFIATGGACTHDTGIVSGVACKAVGGTWFGGHDLSGHFFILVLSTAFLWMEVLWVVLRADGWPEERIVVGGTGGGEVRIASTESVVDESMRRPEAETRPAFKVALAVVALSWWMLLMTAAYFHSWFEKSTGLVVALLGIFFVYYVPRGSPTVRQMIGMPGV